MTLLLAILLAVLLVIAPVLGGSLADIEHVVIFMQENRSWNNYFGTMAGVRGFNDPNVQINPDGKSVWHQKVEPHMSNASDTLLPWYLAYPGGDWHGAIQCMTAGDNSYQANQAALNYGLNNHWATRNTPESWGYYKREDIPIQFAIAEGWTSGDMYQESQITATNPNRVTLVSGSINVPGGPQSPDQGGPYLDNNEGNGCKNGAYSCFPPKWKTIYEFYEEAGVSWHIYQDQNNFDDNPLAWFEQFRNAQDGSMLKAKGMSYTGLDSFYRDAANGSLPEISFIVGPQELSEHPPWMPKDGAWLQKQIVDAMTSSPKYSSTLLIVSFDETGGFGDHVTPFHSPRGTPGEWMIDPLGKYGEVFVGPGFRVPFYMVSPWTRGGRVFTERADHNSQILFLEEWLEARGHKEIRTDQMVRWRREHMSNLVNALDFDNPDLSLPDIPEAEHPMIDPRGNYVGTADCGMHHPVQKPPPPYGNQEDPTNTLFFEDGFKEVRGYLTEGRYLVLEKAGAALTNKLKSSSLTTSRASELHNFKAQRWILHYHGGEESGLFLISSALDGRWLGTRGRMHISDNKADAEPMRIKFRGNGKGYYVQYAKTGEYIDVNHVGKLEIRDSWNVPPRGYTIFSVSYHD